MADTKIIIHHSASDFGHAIMIDKWHREKGWKGIGYHFVIQNGYPTKTHFDDRRQAKLLNGAIELGRTIDDNDNIDAWEEGAHAYGYNKNTIGICLIGNDTITRQQLIALIQVIKLVQFQFHVKTSDIFGHRELPGADTECPNLDMDVVRKLVLNKTEGMKLLKQMPNVV